MSNQTYFAQQKTQKIGTEIKKKIDSYYVFMNQSGIFKRQHKSLSHYYGISPVSSASTQGIKPGGKTGQLNMVKVNHFRNLGQHLLQLTTSKKPSPIPIATNSDAKSQKQCTVARGVIEYYNREKRIDRKNKQAVQKAIVAGQAFVQTVYGNGGSQGVQSGEEGDAIITVLPSSQVIRDPNKSDYDSLDWIITREWLDRFQVASRYAPSKQDSQAAVEAGQSQIGLIRSKILGQRTKNAYDNQTMPMINWLFQTNMMGQSEDIAVYHFWHKKTASVPNGRYVILLEDGTVLFDTELPYQDIPVRRICPANLQGTPFGYTPMFDMIVLQEAIDALYSAIATNQMTFGVQLIMALKGSDLDYKQLAKGLSFIEYGIAQGKPQPLNLTHTPAQVFQFIGQLEKAMETISGVNSVVRGDPPESLKSGSALALVQAQAIQYSSGLQQSYAHLMQDVYTDILNILKSYANKKRMITIVGKFNRSMLLEFTKDDLSQISRVVITVDSALEQTQPGRMQMAQDLIQNGLISRPQQYIAVIKTGSLDPMLEGQNAQLMLIRTENEALAAGQQMHVLATDSHSLHIREHKAILANPDSRNDPAMMNLITNHIVEHVKFLADPGLANLLMVLGQQPLSMAMAPAPGQAAPDTGTPKAPPDSEMNATPNQGGPKMPRMPKNPSTGNEWDPETGGQ